MLHKPAFRGGSMGVKGHHAIELKTDSEKHISDYLIYVVNSSLEKSLDKALDSMKLNLLSQVINSVVTKE